jgi:hypothetical protein
MPTLHFMGGRFDGLTHPSKHKPSHLFLADSNYPDQVHHYAEVGTWLGVTLLHSREELFLQWQGFVDPDDYEQDVTIVHDHS